MEKKFAQRPGTRAQKRRPATAVALIILMAALLICAVSIYNIVSIMSEDSSSSEVTEVMRSYIERVPDAHDGEAPVLQEAQQNQPPAQGLPAAAEAEMPGQLVIDFDGLRALNREIVAWIDIPGTQISYPVTQTDDDAYYLTHSADNTENRAGSIFMDSRSSADFSDKNTIIYGHRMNNGSMFGTLSSFTDRSYLQAHPYICIYTPGAVSPLVYEILSVGQSDASLASPAYQVDFADEAQYAAWAAEIDDSLGSRDQVLTLSTCTRGDSSRRLIVEAKRIL